MLTRSGTNDEITVKKITMKTILQNIARQDRQREKDEVSARKAEVSDPETSSNRREFLKKTGAVLGGISLSNLCFAEDAIARPPKVNRSSNLGT
jgi:hypothetical protein